ncbi:MAG: LysM peptidoglycan-binding domain-containing protein [Gemmatimonadetes bacterium]|nr:LysM peptidoglycan-binding domain-containing protein [Gemmatimonadota bacterium]
MRQLRSRILIALVSALAVTPSAATAQEPVERPATHTVRTGDTLWDLAQQYLGDPFQWQQIYQLNTAIIQDPHWIYPGQELALPGGTLAAAPTGSRGSANSGPTRNMSLTVFNAAARRTENRSRESLLLATPRTAVRSGDFESSPFMWDVGGPQDAGSIDGSAEPMGIPLSMATRPMQIREQVVVTMPRGVEAVSGLNLLTYRLGAIIKGQGQVVVPTGVVQVIAPLDAGHANAFVLRKYEGIFVGHGVIGLDTLEMPIGVFPTHVEFGMATRVAWVLNHPALPSGGHKLILAAGADAGLVAGDQVSLRAAPVDANGELLDLELGVAQITRVTQWGTSAVLLEVRESGIIAGMRAQVSAKMP